MPRIGFRVPKTYRYILYAILGVSLISGLTFYYLNTWGIVEGPFGPEIHPAQKYFLMVHGASAFLFMMSFGIMLANHVPATWRTKRSRVLGVALVSLGSFQIISAYCLYYIGSPEIRPILANAHTIIGTSIPIILIGHLVAGRKKR